MAMGVCRECGQPVSTSAGKCPHCGIRYPTSAARLRTSIRALLLGGVLLAVCSYIGTHKDTSSDETPSSSAASAEPTAAEELATGAAAKPAAWLPEMPQSEEEFCSAVTTATVKYEVAEEANENELKLSALRRARTHAVLRAVKGGRVKDWLGTIAELSTTGEGNAAVTLRLPCEVHVGTWNNSISDSAYGTLIPHGSRLYAALEEIGIGTHVRFSGLFVPEEVNGFREASITERGSMKEPSFVMKMRDIRKEP
jgi:hypothetical protein